jgi:hypothetical protein
MATQNARVGRAINKPLEQLTLGCLVEVDHDVPTEDQVKGSAHGPGVYEVELTERDEFCRAGT